MTDDTPPPRARSSTLVTNLEPRLASLPAAKLLAKVPWDGPRLDPDALAARAMLAWLR